MQHRQIAWLTLVGIGVAAIGVCLTLRTAPEARKPPLVSSYPPFQAVTTGMDRGQVRNLLGTPSRTRIHSKAIAWTSAQLKRLYDEDARLMAELGNRPTSEFQTNPSLHRKFDRLMKVRDLEDKRIRETWQYYRIPGWDGSIEIQFDTAGHVIGKSGGYG